MRFSSLLLFGTALVVANAQHGSFNKDPSFDLAERDVAERDFISGLKSLGDEIFGGGTTSTEDTDTATATETATAKTTASATDATTTAETTSTESTAKTTKTSSTSKTSTTLSSTTSSSTTSSTSTTSTITSAASSTSTTASTSSSSSSSSTSTPSPTPNLSSQTSSTSSSSNSSSQISTAGIITAVILSLAAAASILYVLYRIISARRRRITRERAEIAEKSLAAFDLDANHDESGNASVRSVAAFYDPETLRNDRDRQRRYDPHPGTPTQYGNETQSLRFSFAQPTPTHLQSPHQGYNNGNQYSYVAPSPSYVNDSHDRNEAVSRIQSPVSAHVVDAHAFEFEPVQARFVSHGQGNGNGNPGNGNGNGAVPHGW